MDLPLELIVFEKRGERKKRRGRTTTLGETHSDGRGTASSGSTDADDLADSFWVEPPGSERLHTAHGAADAGMESVDAEMIEKAELGIDHVEQGEKGKMGGPRSTGGLVDG